MTLFCHPQSQPRFMLIKAQESTDYLALIAQAVKALQPEASTCLVAIIWSMATTSPGNQHSTVMNGLLRNQPVSIKNGSSRNSCLAVSGCIKIKLRCNRV